MKRLLAVALLGALPLLPASHADTLLPGTPGNPARADNLLLLDVATAGRRMVAVGERGHVLLSDDEGRGWRYAASPTEATLTAVFFADDRHGWAVGHDAVILRSDDGGDTWEQVHSAPSELKPLLDVWFATAQHGYAVGAYGLAYETADGGRTWRRRTILRDDMHMNAIAGGADGQLFIAGEAGTLLRSTDAGRQWTYLDSPYRGSFFGVLRLPDEAVLIFGLRGRIYRSSDGGRTWKAVRTESQASLMGGRVLPDGTVALVGHEGTVLASSDQGRTFVLQQLANGKALAAVAAARESAWVLFGEDGASAYARAPR